MWDVYETRSAARQLDVLPLDILKRFEKWKDVVRLSGPEGLRMIRGFRDEALSGEWAGHRSSRLNQQYRVIYLIERTAIRVEVVRVSAHDYRKR
jgi:addiction module RelE/StbE family toxin